MNLKLIVSLLLMSAFYGCSKDDDNNTQSTPGNSYPVPEFSAYLNGNLFKADNFADTFKIQNNISTRTISIMAIDGMSAGYMHIFMQDSILKENVSLNTIPSNWTFSGITYNVPSSTHYEGLYFDNHIIFTDQDTVQNLLCGTFSGKIFNFNGDTIKVTNGIFKNVPYEFINVN